MSRDLFGGEALQEGEEPVVLIKFRFKCWNDDPTGLTKQQFEKVEVEVHAEDLEDALKRVRELVNRKHHDVVKIYEPKPKKGAV